jgi:hypothetical protein
MPLSLKKPTKLADMSLRYFNGKYPRYRSRYRARAPYLVSVTCNLIAVSLSFRLVRNLSDGFKEGFPMRFTYGNDKYTEFIHRLY